jgi:hypothetical protein
LKQLPLWCCTFSSKVSLCRGGRSLKEGVPSRMNVRQSMT